VQYLYNCTSTAIADFTNIDNWEKVNLEEEFEAITHKVLHFVQGVNYPSSAGHGSSTEYCRTDYFAVKKGDVIKAKDATLRLYVQYSVDATVPSLIENKVYLYVVKADGYIRLNIDKASGGNIVPSECNGKISFISESTSISFFREIQSYTNESSKLNVPIIDFINGAINRGAETPSNESCRSAFLYLKAGSVIDNDSTYTLVVHKYTSADNSSWVADSLSPNITEDAYYRVVLTSTGNITPLNLLGKVSYRVPGSARTQIEGIVASLPGLIEQRFKPIINSSSLRTPVKFEQGGIYNGADSASNARVRSGFIYMQAGTVIFNSLYRMYINQYTSEDSSSWVEQEDVSLGKDYTVTTSNYYRIVCYKNNANDNITPAEADDNILYGFGEDNRIYIPVVSGVVSPTSGDESPNSEYCRSGYLYLSANKKICIKNNLRIGVLYYKNGAGSAPTKNTVNNSDYLVPVNGVYRLNVFKFGSATITPDEVKENLYIVDCKRDDEEIQNIAYAEFYDRLSTNALDGFAAKLISLNKNGARFLFFTDIHHINVASNLNVYKNLYKVITAKQFISKGLIDCTLIGGDLTTEQNDKQLNLTRITQVMEQLNRGYAGKPILVAKGNHDTALAGSSSSWSDALVISDKEWHDATLRNIEGVANFQSAESTYYFYDDKFRKIRYICLDTFSYPIKADNTYNNPRDIEFINQSQYNWLISDALDFSAVEDRNNWNVIIFAHSTPERNKSHNMQALLDIVNAFINGGTVSKSYTDGDTRFDISISADFTSQGAINVQAMVHGHDHWDEVYIDSGCPVPQIAVIATDTYYPPSIPSYGVTPTRVEEDLSAQGFDVFTCDSANHIIYTNRFGAGNDRIIHNDVNNVGSGNTITLTSVLEGTLSWVSQNTNIATVSGGVVTGVSDGYVAIYAEDSNGKREYFVISVE
jgi:hypothetical protein